MAGSKKVVLIVGSILCALIVLPLLILLVSRSESNSVVTAEPLVKFESAVTGSVGASFELRQLQKQAVELMAGDLADALRSGEVPLAFIAGLDHSQQQASNALNAGDFISATALYQDLLQRAQVELSALALSKQARELQLRTYAELERLQSFRPAFEQTYLQAVAQYDAGLADEGSRQFAASVAAYEMALQVLQQLEMRTIERLEGLLVVGSEALSGYDLTVARSVFEEVLQLDADNRVALAGLNTAVDLSNLGGRVLVIEQVEQAGDWDSALSQWQKLGLKYPENSFVSARIVQAQARLLTRDYQAKLLEVDAAEASGDYKLAVHALESALDLKSSAKLLVRLQLLKKKLQADELEQLLATGFAALQAGDFESARNTYRSSVALAADSKEAQAGLEKASSLYLASIRFNQNLASAAKYVEAGRYPLAAKLFNNAMSLRPSAIGSQQLAEEIRLREILELQSQKVVISLQSDKRTYVSIISVLPPDRFRSTELRLFPDVYTIKGTRPGYVPIEVEFRVEAGLTNPVIKITCSEKI